MVDRAGKVESTSGEVFEASVGSHRAIIAPLWTLRRMHREVFPSVFPIFVNIVKSFAERNHLLIPAPWKRTVGDGQVIGSG